VLSLQVDGHRLHPEQSLFAPDLLRPFDPESLFDPKIAKAEALKIELLECLEMASASPECAVSKHLFLDSLGRLA
jgi:hypothetical protein